MKVLRLVLGLILFAIAISGVLIADKPLFAEYPLPPATGCCKQRDWLAGEWYKTTLSGSECEELNRNRDNQDDPYVATGYVWWDLTCRL